VKKVALLLLIISGMLVPSHVSGSEPFSIGFDDWVGFGPFFLAADKDFFHGVAVRFSRINDEEQRRAGLASGRLQMLCETMGMFEAGRKTADYDGKLIFALDESRGADAVLASKEINSVSDVKGRKVAGQWGSHSYNLLVAALARKGMKLTDLAFLDMPMAQAAAAFVSGNVDAICTYEPHVFSALRGRPGAHVLLSSGDFPGVVVDVAIAKKDLISVRREDLEKIYEGWTKAVAYMREHPDESARIIAGAIGTSADEFTMMSAGLSFLGKEENEKYFGVATPCCESDAAAMFNLMGRALTINGLTDAVSPGSEKIDFSIVGSGIKISPLPGTSEKQRP
jgi:NitT/TauT family transport system substrate-binding protein